MATTDQNAPVVTSVGIITPYGLGLEAFLAGLASGNAPDSPAKCPELDVQEWLPSEKTYLDRCSELALVAAAMALGEGSTGCESEIRLTPVPPGATGETPVVPERIGLALGTAYGCLDSMCANTTRVQTKGARLASPLLFMHSFANAPASLIAIEWGLQGPGMTFTDGGLSAASALYWACDLLRRGQVDMMLVGGVEALSEPLVRSMVGGRWSPAGREASPPCPPPLAGEGGETETGVQPWEAAVVFMLERAEVAEARGARGLAEVREVRLGSGGDAASPPHTGETPAPPGGEAGGAAGATRTEGGSDGRDARRTGEGFYAWGAQFGLLIAKALGDLARGNSVTVEQAEGGRTAKIMLTAP